MVGTYDSTSKVMRLYLGFGICKLTIRRKAAPVVRLSD
jgi:hypothetical protein